MSPLPPWAPSCTLAICCAEQSLLSFLSELGLCELAPLWPGIGYKGPDPERSQKPGQARLQAEAVLQQAMLHVGDAPCKDPQDFLELIRSGMGKAFCGKASNSASDAGSRPALCLLMSHTI